MTALLVLAGCRSEPVSQSPAQATEPVPAPRSPGLKVRVTVEGLPAAGAAIKVFAYRPPVDTGSCTLDEMEVHVSTICVSSREYRARVLEGFAGPILTGTTDAAGILELPARPDAGVSIWAEDSKGRKALAEPLAPDELEVGLELAPTPVAAFRVTSERRPVPNAKVRVLHRGSGYAFEATADENGTFRVGTLPPVELLLSIEAAGFVPWFGRVGEARPGTIELEPETVVSGIVRRNGLPVAGASVASTLELEGVVTDARGRYRLTGLWDAESDLVARSGSLAAWRSVKRSGARNLAVDFELTPGADVDGIVSSANGHPLSGATVRLWRPFPATGRPLTTMADEQGWFRFQALAPRAPMWIQAESPGFRHRSVPLTTAGAAGRTELTLALDAASGLEGVVVGESGEALGGAKVWAMRQDDEDSGTSDERDAAGSPNVLNAKYGGGAADGSGHFKFDGLRAGQYLVRVTHPTRVGRLVRMQLPDVQARIQLATGFPIRGRVEDEKHQPLVGVEISIRGDLDTYVDRPRVSTDRAGQFEILGVGAGSYLLAFQLAKTGKHHIELFRKLEVTRSAPPPPLLVTRPPLGAISGVVVDAAGHPVGHARAAVVDEGPHGLTVAYTSADEQGRFKLGPLLAGKYLVTATAGGERLETSPSFQTAVGVLASTDDRDLRVLAYSQGFVIGRALTRAGEAPARLEVINGELRGDLSGGFRVPISSSGSLRFELRAPGYARRVVTVDAKLGKDQTLEDIVLTPGRFVSGTVRSDDGRPLAGAVVGVGGLRHAPVFSGDELPEGAELLDQVVTKDDGEFDLDHLPDGVIEVQVTHPRHAPQVVQLEPGRAEVQVRLQPGATVEGRVVGSSGVVVANAEVRVISGAYQRTARSDLSGHYQIYGVPPGPAVVVARMVPTTERVAASGHVGRECSPSALEVPLSGRVHLDLLERRDGARVTIRARMPDGSRLGTHGAHHGSSPITLLPGRQAAPRSGPGLERLRWLQWEPRAVQFEDSAVEFRAVPAGDYTVFVEQPREGEPGPRVFALNIVVTRAAHQSFDLQLSGTAPPIDLEE